MKSVQRPISVLEQANGLIPAAAVPKLRARADLHLPRKIWHMGMGLLIVGLYQGGMPRVTAVTILGLVLAAFLSLELARLRIPALNAASVRLWGSLMRTGEENRVSGMPYYIASTLLAIAIFPKPVAVLSILFLAIGDPLASLVGILYGKLGPRLGNGKSLIGTGAGIAACLVTSVLFLQGLSLPLGTEIALVVIGGIVGGTVELLPLEVDDNFSIPVISGFFLWFAFLVLGV